MDEEFYKEDISKKEKPIEVCVIEDKVKRKGETTRIVLTLISLVIACLSLWLSKKSIDRSIESGIKTKEYVDMLDSGIINMNTQFKQLSEEIKDLPQSVVKLDTVMSGMGQQIEGLKGGISSFHSIMTQFNSVAETSVFLLKKWETELEKRPQIEFTYYTISRDSNNILTVVPWLLNSGKKFTNNIQIIVYPKNNYNFKSAAWMKTDTESSVQIYSLMINRFIGPKSDNSSVRPGIIVVGGIYQIRIPQGHENVAIPLPFDISYEYEYDVNDTLLLPIPEPGKTIKNFRVYSPSGSDNSP